MQPDAIRGELQGRFFRSMLAALALLTSASVVRAGTVCLDLAPAANASMEDDGIPNNGAGGWSDEGANDMFTCPAIPYGPVTRNGHQFRLLDPAANGGCNVILLRGSLRSKDKPASVKLPAGDVKGAFIYFLQNSFGNVSGQPKNHLVARYTVTYADGTTAELPMRDGLELQHWWVGAWWENAGAAAWPMFMGQNAYSGKWNQYIGVWATQWPNPTPEKAIHEITFNSEGLDAAAIFAVTVSDEDWQKSPDIKKDFLRPGGVPAGYFDAKLAIEARAIATGMKERGMLKGLRRVEVIRPDLVAVVLDTAVANGPGMGETAAAALQKPACFAIAATGDDAYAKPVAPAKVGRHSWLYDTTNVGSFPLNDLYWHTYYLQLPTPLHNGGSYTFTVTGLPAGVQTSATVAYTDKATETPVIKVNQAAYSSKSSVRYAYLGWWAGDLGPVDYAVFTSFQVVSIPGEAMVFSGKITARRPAAEIADKGKLAESGISGENVFELDLSPVSKPGRYAIIVPGLGRSCTFAIGGEAMHDTYATAVRGFLFQRCGATLTPAEGDFPRPPCHTTNRADGRLVTEHNPAHGQAVKEFSGGYHDAGDFDIFYGHLTATAQMLLAFERNPGAFRDGDLRLPEGKNGLPDLLDEAEWGLRFYATTQAEDGAVFAGRANDEDYGDKDWKNEFKKWKEQNPAWRQYGDLPPFGCFFPCNASANSFAATATLFSRCVRPFDAARADQYLARARKAYDWAAAHHAPGYEQTGITYGAMPWQRAWAWAAAEMFKTTGEARYNTDFIALYKEGLALKGDWRTDSQMPFFKWPYASCTREGTDPEIRKTLTAAIVKAADDTANGTARHGYRLGSGRPEGGWGTLCGGLYYSANSLYAYWLTGQQKYLDTAALNADYQLGANPLSRSFITGLGARPPEHPELRDWLYDAKGVPSPGVPVFGPGGNPGSLKGVYPKEVPLWRCWLDNRVAAMHSEFTIEGPIGGSAMLYSALWALETEPAK